jgi:hypothetical protein
MFISSACVSVSIFEFSDETPPFFLDADSPCYGPTRSVVAAPDDTS